MTGAEFVGVASSLIFASGIILVLWVAFPKYAIDKFRQEMFIIRDRFFDEAVAGKIEFSSDAYHLMRELMNVHIRFAHRLGLIEMSIIVTAVYRNNTTDCGVVFVDRFERALSQLDKKEKELVVAYYEQVMQLVLRKLTLGSASVMFIIPAFLGAYVVKNFIELTLKRLKRPVEIVNGAFLTERDADPDGMCDMTV